MGQPSLANVRKNDRTDTLRVFTLYDVSCQKKTTPTQMKSNVQFFKTNLFEYFRNGRSVALIPDDDVVYHATSSLKYETDSRVH